MYFLAKMKDKSASEMLGAVVKTLKGIEVKTMTYDNGTENTKHKEINEILNCAQDKNKQDMVKLLKQYRATE